MTTDRPWQDPSLAPQERALALVAAMSLEQKIAQLHGNMETIDIYSVNIADADVNQFDVKRHVAGDDDLGIPRMRVTNGPVGVGMGDGVDSPEATSLPMTFALAAGFDPALAADYGDIIGSETHTYGQHVLEGPGLCLHRLPTGGRNFEYFSEDPYLTGVMGVEVTKAIQAHGIIAMAKHFAVNDTEVQRFRTNVEVDERVLRELYLVPFEMVVKDGGVHAIMSAYNRVRGTYATENRYLLNDILRREWGFAGYVQSDFWSARSAAPALHAGLDLEMPDGKWLSEANVTAALNDTSLELAAIDRALVRRFSAMFQLGQFEWPYEPGTVDAAGHGARARALGRQFAVLLKNEPANDDYTALLPLDPSQGRIVVVGQSAYAEHACLGGGGSSRVKPLYTVDPAPGLRDVIAELGGNATVDLQVVADDLADLDAAVEAARGADTVVVMAGLVATEGEDLGSLHMPNGQDAMIEALLAANPRTVVVLKDSNPVVMPWIDAAPAVLEAFNQGSEDGHVVADLLFGAANPCGKLPTTYARSADDLPTAGDLRRYPGTDEGDGYPTMHYSEGLRMGYRWYQSEGIEPLFPFGHGLSYTTFAVDDLAVEAGQVPGETPVTVRASVTNTGVRAGAEVVQVYLGLPPETGQPPLRLVGFQKVSLEPGARADVEITLDPAATNHPLSVWSDAQREFVVPAGTFTVHVGTSSAVTNPAGGFTVAAQ
ncbi:beta-glucosidase [Kribbia dieselivorans]|uniref:beta-glucosidase n=1 Tax=Kribbia dieselivorans TaxID=331526 RepID=UPI0008389B15|nr:glycoside hydrolase family 3 C-terminal domain-containing protein [Kribbia dieselivorans]